MLSILILILVFWGLGKMIGFSFRISWALCKAAMLLVILPLFVFCVMVAGIIRLALPILVLCLVIAVIRDREYE